MQPIRISSRLHRLGNEMALRKIAAKRRQQIPLCLRFDAFSNRENIEIPGQLKTRAQNHLRRFMRNRAPHEGPIDLQLSKRDARELLHRGVTRSKVVDRQSKTHHPQAREIFKGAA